MRISSLNVPAVEAGDTWRICGRCGYDWALEDLREWESRWRLREIFFAVWAMERRQEGSRRLRQPRTVDSVAVISNKQRTWRSDRRRNTLCGATVHLHVSYQPSPQYKLPGLSPNIHPSIPQSTDIPCFFPFSISMRVCKADLVHLSPRSNGVRKSIARVLTVINQKQRQNVRELYKSKNAKCTSTHGLRLC